MRSVFSHGLQVAKPEPDPPDSEAERSAHCPQCPWTSVTLPVRVGMPAPPRLVPTVGSDELPPVERPGGQQSSAWCSHRMSSEPFFLSVAVGLVYVHRAPERLFSNLGHGCGGSDVVPLPCLPGRLLPGRVPAGEGLRGESPSWWNPAACAASCFLCFLCACFPRKL